MPMESWPNLTQEWALKSKTENFPYPKVPTTLVVRWVTQVSVLGKILARPKSETWNHRNLVIIYNSDVIELHALKEKKEILEQSKRNRVEKLYFLSIVILIELNIEESYLCLKLEI